MSEEAIREAVLLETLSRLLREKIGADGASPVPPWRRPQAEAGAPSVTSGIGSAIQPEEPAAIPVTAADVIGATEIKREAPLEKFIRVFGLDELAAKCLLKLQDDEAAFVIELPDEIDMALATSVANSVRVSPSRSRSRSLSCLEACLDVDVEMRR